MFNCFRTILKPIQPKPIHSMHNQTATKSNQTKWITCTYLAHIIVCPNSVCLGDQPSGWVGLILVQDPWVGKQYYVLLQWPYAPMFLVVLMGTWHSGTFLMETLCYARIDVNVSIVAEVLKLLPNKFSNKRGSFLFSLFPARDAPSSTHLIDVKSVNRHRDLTPWYV